MFYISEIEIEKVYRREREVERGNKRIYCCNFAGESLLVITFANYVHNCNELKVLPLFVVIILYIDSKLIN